MSAPLEGVRGPVLHQYGGCGQGVIGQRVGEQYAWGGTFLFQGQPINKLCFQCSGWPILWPVGRPHFFFFSFFFFLLRTYKKKKSGQRYVLPPYYTTIAFWSCPLLSFLYRPLLFRVTDHCLPPTLILTLSKTKLSIKVIQILLQRFSYKESHVFHKIE